MYWMLQDNYLWNKLDFVDVIRIDSWHFFTDIAQQFYIYEDYQIGKLLVGHHHYYIAC